MAYVERPPAFASVGDQTVSLLRSDLFVVDSEAQGVRVLQFAQGVDSGRVVFLEPFFVPAPASLFKLAVDAPGFPTQIATVSTATRTASVRAYVLAAASAEIHVLRMGDIPYQGSSVGDAYARVGTIKLLNLLAAIDPEVFPVDLVRLGQAVSADGPLDEVLVAFDSLGEGPGRLYLFRITADARPRVASLRSVPLPVGVSDLALVESEGRRFALVTSASTPVVTQVPLLEGDETELGPPRGIDVGGVTGAVIEAGSTGAFALRLDRSAAVWLRPGPEGLERANVPLDSPYEPAGDSTEELGVLTLREPLAVTGASAPLPRLGVPTLASFVFDQESGVRDVVLLVHANGVATFVLGPTAGEPLPTVATGGLVRLADAFSSDFEPDETPTLDIPECPEVPVCDEARPNQTFCAFEALEARPFIGRQLLRVTPRGPLLVGGNAALSVGSVDTSTLPPFVRLEATLVDTRLDDLEPHRLRPLEDAPLGVPPDVVQVELEIPGCAGETVEATFAGELLATGTGEDRRGDLVETGSSLTARLEQVLTSTQPDLIARRCPEALATLDRALGYEVRVPDTVDEAVLSEVIGEFIVRVLERAEMVIPPSTPGQARMFFGEDPSTSASPVRFSVMGPVAADPLEALECVTRTGTVTTEGASLGRCLSAAECGGGRECVGASGICPGFCRASCSGPCFVPFVARVCPRLDIDVVGPAVEVDLRAAELRAGESLLDGSGTVPADALFHPQRRSFFVSFPGSRTVVEMPVGAAGAGLLRLR